MFKRTASGILDKGPGLVLLMSKLLVSCRYYEITGGTAEQGASSYPEQQAEDPRLCPKDREGSVERK